MANSLAVSVYEEARPVTSVELLEALDGLLGVAHSSMSKTMNTLSTYYVNHTTIASLSVMIVNANGRDISAARNELIQFLHQQIELVKVMEEKTWEDAEKYNDILWKLDDKFYRDECNENFEEYSSALTKSEEIADRACRYGHELNILQTLRDILEEEKRRQTQLVTVMSASHPRVVAATPLGKLDKELWAKIALLSVE